MLVPIPGATLSSDESDEFPTDSVLLVQVRLVGFFLESTDTACCCLLESVAGEIWCCRLEGADRTGGCWSNWGLLVVGRVGCCCLGGSGVAVNVLIMVAIVSATLIIFSVSGVTWGCWLERSGVISCWFGLVLFVIGEAWLGKSGEAWGC